MTTPTIPNGQEHFFPILYEGNGAGQRVGRFVPFTDQATVANSCIFNGTTNNYLSRTASSNGSATTLTFSCWVKRGLLGLRDIVYNGNITSNSEHLHFDANNKLNYYEAGGGSRKWNYVTSRTFEDTSKWYHILVVRDTTNSTAGDRIKIYVDGDRVTSFDTETQPSLNATGYWNQTSYAFNIGTTGNASYIRGIGYLAEVNMIDGQALLPASFGITDTSTGRWIPKTVEPFPTTTTDIAVTVVSSGGNKYALDGVTQGTVTLIEGATYKFDQSDSSNSGHPLRFSTTSDGTHGGGSEFTSGVTTAGTPGSSGAYTQITVPTGTATLYYYCSVHSGMGGTANTQDQYGTNGFRLKFQDSSALGDDTSGKGNDLTATNLASTDQTTDSPSQNFATGLGAFQTSYAMTMSEGNLKSAATGGSGQHGKSSTTLTFDANDSDGYYCEYTVNAGAGVGQNFNAVAITVDREAYSVPNASNGKISGQVRYMEDGRFRMTNLAGTLTDISSWGSTWGDVSAPDIIGIFVKNNKIYFSKNNTWQNSANPNNETGGMDVEGTIGNNRVRFSHIGYQAGATGGTMTANFGQKSFTYTPPTGYKKLNQDNLPETSKGIPGMAWFKHRDGTGNHLLIDSSRGGNKQLQPNLTNSELTQPDMIQKFLVGGYSVEDFVNLNNADRSYVSWNWVSNSGSTSSNTGGSITSTVQANTTAGFSIVEYTGTGSSGSVGHGLSAAPEWMIFKDKGNSTGWRVYHKSLGGITKYIVLNTTAAVATASMWGAPTASSFIIGGTGYEVNESGNNYIAYCWHEVDGFSKFGSYTGNASADGPFVHTGFKPAWVMVKNASASSSWAIFDTQRSTINPINKYILANSSNAEASATSLNTDFLSNGFKIRGTDGGYNGSGNTIIYMAFAKHPFVGDGTNPVTAR